MLNTVCSVSALKDDRPGRWYVLSAVSYLVKSVSLLRTAFFIYTKWYSFLKKRHIKCCCLAVKQVPVCPSRDLLVKRSIDRKVLPFNLLAVNNCWLVETFDSMIRWNLVTNDIFLAEVSFQKRRFGGLQATLKYNPYPCNFYKRQPHAESITQLKKYNFILKLKRDDYLYSLN